MIGYDALVDILTELDARGQVADVTSRDEVLKLLSGEKPVTFYVGFDPTATSLHLGSLVQIALMVRLQRAGHKPLAVVGGGTGMIGDPSGKSAERSLLDATTLERNCELLRAQLGRFLDFGEGPQKAELINNLSWLGQLTLVEFLRDIGKLLSVNYMIGKESVRARLEDREQGISYTEFSYMLLQSYDFVHLAKEYGCQLQCGGSDQWGNITAGCELQRKLGRPPVYGLTVPLLLDSHGEKMGKTAAGTRVWLDAAETSPYAFYQYLLNVADDDVERLMKTFSFKPLAEIERVITEHKEAPHKRVAQRALADEVTVWVHGQAARDKAIAASQVLFGGSLDGLSDSDLEPLLQDVPTSAVARSELDAGLPLVELLVQSTLVKSKGEGRRLLSQKGVYINNRVVEDPEKRVDSSDLGTETMLILRAGKKKYHIVTVR